MARVGFDITIPDAPNTGGNLIERQSTLGEVAQASFLNGVNSAETSSIYRSIKLAFSGKDDDIVNHHELNKQFPEVDVPFNQPTSLSTAEEIARRSRERRRLGEIIAKGDPDSMMVKAVSFGANFIPQALDPVGLASGLLIGGGLTKVLGGIGKLGKAVPSAFKAGFARQAAEGITGNLIAETVFVNPASRQEQADVNTYESLTNAVAAGIAFPAVIGAAGKTINFLKKGVKGQSRMAKASALTEAQGQKGLRANVEDYAQAEKKAEVPAMTKEIEGMKAKGGEVDSLQQELNEIQDLAELDRAEVAQKANAREAELYFDPEAEKAFDDSVRALEPAERSTEIKENFEVADNTLKELEAEGELSAKDIEVAKELRTKFNEVDKIDEMIKAATVCVRGN